MATRLQQIVTALAVAPGAQAVITHNLNVDGTAVIPDRIDRSNLGFSGIAATTASVTVQNDTDAVANISLYLRYYHTIDRVYGAKATKVLTPDPWWDGGSASTVIAASAITEFVYQPGGAAAGPVVFASFPDLYTALVAARTAGGGDIPIMLGYDTSLGAATVPAGTYDFTNVKQVGLSDGAQVTVTYADGTVFTGARHWDNLLIISANTVTAPITDVVDGTQLLLRKTTFSATTGTTVGVVAYTLAGAGNARMVLLERSTLGGAQTGRVVVAAGAHTLTLALDTQSTIALPTTVQGAAASTLTILGASGVNLPGVNDLSNWAGTKGWTTFEAAASLAPTSLSTVAVTAAHGQWLRLSTSVGDLSQDLPSIASATNGQAAPGTMILINNDNSSGNNLTINCAAGDNFVNNGAAGLTTSMGVPRGGSVLLISDGVGFWYVVAAWGLNRYQPAEVWFQDNVAANQNNVDFGTRVSGNFDTWLAPKGGSIIGLVTRYTESVTAGTATVSVTVNGTEVPLNIASTVGSNPDGGTTTVINGTTGLVYAAGDLLGVSITTDGAFAPNTTDIEAYIIIAEQP